MTRNIAASLRQLNFLFLCGTMHTMQGRSTVSEYRLQQQRKARNLRE